MSFHHVTRIHCSNWLVHHHRCVLYTAPHRQQYTTTSTQELKQLRPRLKQLAVFQGNSELTASVSDCSPGPRAEAGVQGIMGISGLIFADWRREQCQPTLCRSRLGRSAELR